MSTSGSRTAVAEQSGAKSQLAGLVGRGARRRAAAVPELAACRPPQTALAAVVIVAALSLMDLGILRRYLRACAAAPWAYRWSATAGVILLGVLQGIVVAVLLAILLFFRRNWWPHGAVLGRVGAIEGWHDVAQLSRAPSSSRGSWSTAGRRRCSSPTPAPSASRSAASCASESRPGSSSSARRSPTWTSPPAEMLEQLDRELNDAGIHLAFAELRSRLQDLTLRYGLMDDARSRPLLSDARVGAGGDRCAGGSLRAARGPRGVRAPVRPIHDRLSLTAHLCQVAYCGRPVGR